MSKTGLYLSCSKYMIKYELLKMLGRKTNVLDIFLYILIPLAHLNIKLLSITIYKILDNINKY